MFKTFLNSRYELLRLIVPEVFMFVSERCYKYGVRCQYDDSSTDAEDQGISSYGLITTFPYIM
jgi:hypothetical protein